MDNTDIYNQLTSSSTHDFLDSLKYRKNGKRLVKALKILNDNNIEYSVIKGFNSDSEEIDFREFKCCVIKTEKDIETLNCLFKGLDIKVIRFNEDKLIKIEGR